MIPIPGAEHVRRVPQPVLGYVMALAAAALFGVNGTVSKVALDDLSTYRLAEVRCAGAFVILAAIVVATRRDVCSLPGLVTATMTKKMASESMQRSSASR